MYFCHGEAVFDDAFGYKSSSYLVHVAVKENTQNLSLKRKPEL